MPETAVLPKMSVFTLQIIVLVLFTVTYHVSSQKIHEPCESHAVCPNDSSCRPDACNGYNCLCDEGFKPTIDYTGCIEGSFIGQQCDGMTSTCVSLFSQCNGGKCECLFIARQTNTSRPFCSTGNAVTEPCSNSFDCSDRFAICSNGTCVCEPGFRLQTNAEFWANPFEECIEENMSPEKCGSVDVVVPSLLVSVSSSAVEASSSVDIPETSLALTSFESTSVSLSTDYATPIDATSVMIASSPAVSSTEVIFSDQSTSIDSASSVEPTQSLLLASMSLTGSDVVPTPSSTIAASSVIQQTDATGSISEEPTIIPTPSSSEVLSSAPQSGTTAMLSATDSSQILLETSSVSVDRIVSSSQIATDQIVPSSLIEPSHTPVYSPSLDNPGLLTSNSPQVDLSSSLDASLTLLYLTNTVLPHSLTATPLLTASSSLSSSLDSIASSMTATLSISTSPSATHDVIASSTLSISTSQLVSNDILTSSISATLPSLLSSTPSLSPSVTSQTVPFGQSVETSVLNSVTATQTLDLLIDMSTIITETRSVVSTVNLLSSSSSLSATSAPLDTVAHTSASLTQTQTASLASVAQSRTTAPAVLDTSFPATSSMPIYSSISASIVIPVAMSSLSYTPVGAITSSPLETDVHSLSQSVSNSLLRPTMSFYLSSVESRDELSSDNAQNENVSPMHGSNATDGITLDPTSTIFNTPSMTSDNSSDQSSTMSNITEAGSENLHMDQNLIDIDPLVHTNLRIFEGIVVIDNKDPPHESASISKMAVASSDSLRMDPTRLMDIDSSLQTDQPSFDTVLLTHTTARPDLSVGNNLIPLNFIEYSHSSILDDLQSSLGYHVSMTNATTDILFNTVSNSARFTDHTDLMMPALSTLMPTTSEDVHASLGVAITSMLLLSGVLQTENSELSTNTDDLHPSLDNIVSDLKTNTLQNTRTLSEVSINANSNFNQNMYTRTGEVIKTHYREHPDDHLSKTLHSYSNIGPSLFDSIHTQSHGNSLLTHINPNLTPSNSDLTMYATASIGTSDFTHLGPSFTSVVFVETSKSKVITIDPSQVLPGAMEISNMESISLESGKMGNELNTNILMSHGPSSESTWLMGIETNGIMSRPSLGFGNISPVQSFNGISSPGIADDTLPTLSVTPVQNFGSVSSPVVAKDTILTLSGTSLITSQIGSTSFGLSYSVTDSFLPASDAVVVSQSVVSSAVDASISSIDQHLSTSGIDMMSSSPLSSSAPQNSNVMAATLPLGSSVAPTDTTAVLYSVSSIDASYNLATSTEILGASSLTDSSKTLIGVDTSVSGSLPSAALNPVDTTVPLSTTASIVAVPTTSVIDSSTVIATPTATLDAATTVVASGGVTTSVLAASASMDTTVTASSSVIVTSKIGVTASPVVTTVDATASSLAASVDATVANADSSSIAATTTVAVAATSLSVATSTVGVAAASSVAVTSTVGVVATSSVAPTSTVNVAASSSVIVSSSPTTKTVIIPISNDTLSQERPEILILVGTLAAILFISIVVILVVVACKFDAFGKRRRRSSLSAETSSLSSSGKLTIPRPFIKMTTPGYLNAVSTWNSRVSYNDMPLHYSNAGYRSEV